MYLRKTRRKNKDGSVVEYVALAHNYRDPDSGRPKPQILINFGRREDVDEDGLLRLVDNIYRFLGPEHELAGKTRRPSGVGLSFIESRPMGGAWLLRGLWDQLDIHATLVQVARQQRVPDPETVAGCIWTMVANRALEPLSKHALPEWLASDAYLPGAPEAIYDEQLYRAMDFLLDHGEALQQAVFFASADLLNLDVDLLLYDTTSVYFEMDEDDRQLAEREARWEAHDEAVEGSEPSRPRPQVVNEPPLRLRGHSKDHRPDLPQVVVGLAVTRQGIPVRCWVWPGNTSDASTVAQVKADLAGWKLNRVVWAVDRGMTSEANLRELQRGGAEYIAGERMRSGKPEVEAVLSRPGRYRQVAENLEVKEVVLEEGSLRRRYVVIRNPQQAEHDRQIREQTLARIEAELERLPVEADKHTKAVCALMSHRTMGRFLKTDRRGRPRLDRDKIRAEARLDGKYLVTTSDHSLSSDDVALGYKQLTEVEAAWRTLKSYLDMRPMYHRKAERIHAHVLICWLALLLVRVAEVRCETTWPTIRREMDRLHRGVFEGPQGRYVQRTKLRSKQRQLLKAAKVTFPPRFEAIEPATTGDSGASL